VWATIELMGGAFRSPGSWTSGVSGSRLVAIVLAAAFVGGLTGGAVGILLSGGGEREGAGAPDHAEHPWLGIETETIEPGIAAAGHGLPQRGVVVARVFGGGPAAKAGLAASRRRLTADGTRVLVGGDAIVGINGKPVDSSAALSEMLALHRPGDEVAVDVVRGGVQRTVIVTVGNVPNGTGRGVR
jgi:S1-C subfamily serine protease